MTLGRNPLATFSSDELLRELARRESADGRGGVLFWRSRCVWNIDGNPIVLQHRDGEPTVKNQTVRMQFLIEGDWRGEDWIKDRHAYKPRRVLEFD